MSANKVCEASENHVAHGLPENVLERLELSWQAAIASAEAQSFLNVLPKAWPPSVRALFLRLDRVGTVKGNRERFASLKDYIQRALASERLLALQELVCCHPFGSCSYCADTGEATADVVVALAGLSGLTKLDLSNCRLEDAALRRLVRALRELRGLRSLTMHQVCLPEDGVTTLAPCVGKLTALVHLDLGMHDLDVIGLKVLLNHITAVKQLTFLDLSTRDQRDSVQPLYLDEAATRVLVEFLQGLQLLETLVLDRLACAAVLMKAAVSCIAALPVLQVLSLQRSALGAVGTTALALHLSSMTAFRILSVQGALERNAANRLFDHNSPSPLQSLDLSSNALGTDILERIVSRLSRCCTALTSLDLSDNEHYYDSGAPTLAAHLTRLPGLRELRVASKAGEDTAWDCDFTSLFPPSPGFHDLRVLVLAGQRNLSYPSYKLAKVLTAVTSLQVLDLSATGLGDWDMRELAPAFGSLHCVQDLRLGSNDFGPNGALALAPYLHKLKALKHLDMYLELEMCKSCSREACPNEGVMRLLAAHLTDETSLRVLTLSSQSLKMWKELRAIWTAALCK